MNILDRTIADNLRISRSGYAWGWLQYAQACDAVLMAELVQAPGDMQQRAFPSPAVEMFVCPTIGTFAMHCEPGVNRL